MIEHSGASPLPSPAELERGELHSASACPPPQDHSNSWLWARAEPNDFLLSALLQVIYALNTKNDEHEAAIATLKEAHEEEVQQILSETREKILQVRIAPFSFTKMFIISPSGVKSPNT